MTEAALYRLLTWSSPGYPTGAFSYSHGLEWAVENASVRNLDTLIDYVTAVLSRGGGWIDAVLFAHAWRATRSADAIPQSDATTIQLDTVVQLDTTFAELAVPASPSGASVPHSAAPPSPAGASVPHSAAPPSPAGASVSHSAAPPSPAGASIPHSAAPPSPAGASVPPSTAAVHLDDVAQLASAFRGSAETALESRQQGAAFLDVTRKAWPHPTLEAFAKRSAASDTPIAHCIAVAVTCAAHEIPLVPALHAYMHAVAANLVSAGARLIPLGQTQAQIAIARLATTISGTVQRALSTPLDDLGTCAPAVELCSLHHETQYTRLFRS